MTLGGTPGGTDHSSVAAQAAYNAWLKGQPKPSNDNFSSGSYGSSSGYSGSSGTPAAGFFFVLVLAALIAVGMIGGGIWFGGLMAGWW
jgi:hypothetical protein